MSVDFEEMLKKLDGNSDDIVTNDEWATEMVNERIETIRDTSQISDGSHTFGDLYYHRAVLFATICNMHKDIAWKSKRHEDGSMIDGFFIVGIETPDGQFTYHYPIEDWELFEVKKLNYAKEWDNHSSDDVTRLLSLVDRER